MWKKCKDEYYFLFTQDHHGYEICISDYVTLWTALFTENSLVTQLKNSNCGLEISNNELLKKGLYLLSNLDQLNGLSITKDDNGNSLIISMKHKFGYPFRLECKLLKGSDELYFDKVTRPLLKTIGDLRSSQSELRRLLMKKDKEIEEYKYHVKIDAYRFKTPQYHDHEHMNKFSTYEQNFGSSDVPSHLLDKSVEIPELLVVKEEPTAPTQELNIKQEPCSEIQEPDFVKQEPSTSIPESDVLKQEPNTAISKPSVLKQEPSSIITEPSSVIPEPNTVKPEPTVMKLDLNNIEQEIHTPVFEEPAPIVVPAVSCKQEAVKIERESSQSSQNDRRKRMRKLNY